VLTILDTLLEIKKLLISNMVSIINKKIYKIVFKLVYKVYTKVLTTNIFRF